MGRRCNIVGEKLVLDKKEFSVDELEYLPEGLRPIDLTYRQNNEYYAFFGKANPFSNFFPAEIEIDNISYNCSEQYFHHAKACLFGDQETANRILESETPNEQKKLGDTIVGFKPKVWDKHCESIMKTALKAKFSQHEDLKNQLLDTGNLIMIEASPYDKLWGSGVGLYSDDCLAVTKFSGKNLLGNLLMQIRGEILVAIDDPAKMDTKTRKSKLRSPKPHLDTNI